MHCANRYRSPAGGFGARGRTAPAPPVRREHVPWDRWCAPACGRADRCRGSRWGAGDGCRDRTELLRGRRGAGLGSGRQGAGLGRLRCGQRFGGRSGGSGRGRLAAGSVRAVRQRHHQWDGRRIGCHRVGRHRVGDRRRRGRCGLTPSRHPDDHLAGVDDRRCGPARGGLLLRRGSVVGKRCVQRRRRNTFRGFGCTDHDPVPRGILHKVCGVAGRDHSELAGGLGQGRCGLRFQNVALEGLLLLQQRLSGLPGTTQLIRPFCGVGRQPKRDTQAPARASR